MTTTHTTRNTFTKAITFILLFSLAVITSATLTTISPTYAKQAEHRFKVQVRHHRTHGTNFARPHARPHAHPHARNYYRTP